MDAATVPSQSALDALLEEMGKGGDFPALSRTIAEINRAVGDENSRANALTDIILRDVALTNKLLRLVNTAYYGTLGGQAISTISRAVVVVGFDAVRDAAVSLMLFEHLQNHAQADELKGEAVEGVFCGVLGRMLASSAGVRDGEEAFISALFLNLGRLMARFHFYERTQRIAERVREEGLSESAAAREELGADYDQLGLVIAKIWHFPANILHAMTPLGAPQVRAPHSDHARLQIVANLARELHQTLAAGLSAEKQKERVEALCERYKEAARISQESLQETVRRAAEAVRGEAAILHADVRKSALLLRLLKVDERAAQAETDAAAVGGEDADIPAEILANDVTSNPANDSTTDAGTVLALGMQDLTSMLLSDYRVVDVFKMVAELFYRSGHFDHVMVCALDRPSQCLLGRVGFGDRYEQMRAAFRIPLDFSPDVFHAAISKNQDILISDATADNIRTRIPDWYARSVKAHAFLLLPIVVDKKPLALLYADRVSEPLQLAPQVLGLLKALRNQATLAIRHKS